MRRTRLNGDKEAKVKRAAEATGDDLKSISDLVILRAYRGSQGSPADRRARKY
jgi:hypothetical protein